MAVFTGEAIRWTRQPCEIKDGRVWKVMDVPSEEYNVMEFNGYFGKPPLYDTFASIDHTDMKQIKAFYDKFGFLGFNTSQKYRSREANKDYMELIGNLQSGREVVCHNPMDYLSPEIEAGINEYIAQLQEINENSESIEDIQREIIIMKSILEALEGITAHDSSKLAESIGNALSLSADNSTLEEYGKNELRISGDPFITARINIAELINRYLDDISPAMDVDVYSRNLVGGWEIDNLLAAIYLLLFLDLSKGKLIKHCMNETCTRFFPVSADKIDTKYCNPSCARAQASREYRRREKKKQS